MHAMPLIDQYIETGSQQKTVKQNILILGIGNILQKDDGIGSHIISYILKNHSDIPDNIEVVDGGTAGFDLIPVMKDRDKIVIIDALRVDDKPGSIYRFSPDYIAQPKVSFSLHDAGLKTIIDSLKVMGDSPNIEIIGIVPEDINTLDIGITKSVKESIPRAVEQILEAAAL